MNDLKNIMLAWASTTSALFSAIETRTLITIISAIVLPVVFFIAGKSVDVMLQIYLRKKERSGSEEAKR